MEVTFDKEKSYHPEMKHRYITYTVYEDKRNDQLKETSVFMEAHRLMSFIKGKSRSPHDYSKHVRKLHVERKNLRERRLCQEFNPFFFGQGPSSSINETTIESSNQIRL